MCSPFLFLIYGIVPALSEFKVIHILIILHILFIPVPAVKISPVISYLLFISSIYRSKCASTMFVI